MPTFRTELEQLLNQYNRENGSDTPDFILADYLFNCLLHFDRAVNEREKWYGRKWGKSAIQTKDLEKGE